MLVLVIEPEKEPKVMEISGSLKDMQQMVGGYIQTIYPFPEEVVLVCNDEGKLQKLSPNRGLWDEDGNLYDIICGTFLVCGAPVDSDHFESLTPEQIEKFKRRFHTPEMFVGSSGRILCLPLE